MCYGQRDTSNVNALQLLLLTTPFGMVLQYFDSEAQILFFKRSPKTFVLATIVLMLLLRLLALALQHGGTLLRLLYRKPSVTPKRSQPPGQNSSESRIKHSVNTFDMIRYYRAGTNTECLTIRPKQSAKKRASCALISYFG